MRGGAPAPFVVQCDCELCHCAPGRLCTRQAPWQRARAGPARGRPSGELACANKLYVVVFVTGVMISPSVVRVAALVPDPIQQIKDGGATYEMNELVFSPRYFNVVVTLPH